MNRISHVVRALGVAVLCAIVTVGCTQSESMRDRVAAAMASPERSADDKAIDANRKPIEVLEFFGVEGGMSVLEVVAANGYYTELLSAAVGPDGIVYMHNDEATLARRDGAVERAINERMAGGRLTNVERLNTDIGATGLSGEVDMALVILEFHDTYQFAGEDASLAMMEAIYAAMKPGATLGLIEHAGVAGADNRSLHRIERSTVERMLQEAGFVIEATSDLLANPADDHTLSVFDPAIRRQTDRFVIRARRPS